MVKVSQNVGSGVEERTSKLEQRRRAGVKRDFRVGSRRLNTVFSALGVVIKVRALIFVVSKV